LLDVFGRKSCLILPILSLPDAMRVVVLCFVLFGCESVSGCTLHLLEAGSRVQSERNMVLVTFVWLFFSKKQRLPANH